MNVNGASSLMFVGSAGSVSTGGVLTSSTVSETLCVTVAIPSVSVTSNDTGPSWVSVGVHVNMPVDGLIAAPVGAPDNPNVNV